jgi:anti-sigma-K factor RskA
MNYDKPELRRRLAAEYVLGTLAGPARRRFQRLLETDSSLRQDVAWWENRLHTLYGGLAPVRPRAEVWDDIQRRLGNDLKGAPIVGNVDTALIAANESRFWRFWASVSTAIAAVFALALLLRAPTPVPVAPAPVATSAAPSWVALLQMPNSTMHWTVSLSPQRGEMTAAAGGEPPALDGHSPELWWLSPQGPVAIGVLPLTGGGTMQLPKGMGGGEIKLAVSIEPAGGSPTGKPTGPVVIAVSAVKAV